MSSVVVALLFSAGVAGWTYNKFTRVSGGASTQNTIIVTSIVGLLVFFVAWSIMTAISN